MVSKNYVSLVIGGEIGQKIVEWGREYAQIPKMEIVQLSSKESSKREGRGEKTRGKNS